MSNIYTDRYNEAKANYAAAEKALQELQEVMKTKTSSSIYSVLEKGERDGKDRLAQLKHIVERSWAAMEAAKQREIELEEIERQKMQRLNDIMTQFKARVNDDDKFTYSLTGHLSIKFQFSENVEFTATVRDMIDKYKVSLPYQLATQCRSYRRFKKVKSIVDTLVKAFAEARAQATSTRRRLESATEFSNTIVALLGEGAKVRNLNRSRDVVFTTLAGSMTCSIADSEFTKANVILTGTFTLEQLLAIQAIMKQQ